MSVEGKERKKLVTTISRLIVVSMLFRSFFHHLFALASLISLFDKCVCASLHHCMFLPAAAALVVATVDSKQYHAFETMKRKKRSSPNCCMHPTLNSFSSFLFTSSFFTIYAVQSINVSAIAWALSMCLSPKRWQIKLGVLFSTAIRLFNHWYKNNSMTTQDIVSIESCTHLCQFVNRSITSSMR